MTQLSVSNLSIQSSLTSALQAEQASLTLLSTQLSTQQQHTNLTDYSASDARNLISLQSTATQKQAYLNVISTVSNNLSIYNTTLTDLETISTQAQALAQDNPTYDPSTASTIATQATNFLRSVTVDLNQQINGRYIYAGARYTTPPVQNLYNLDPSTLTSTIETDNTTLPGYDTDSTLSLGVNGSAITVGGAVTAGSGQVASATINGTTYSYTVQDSDTPTDVAAGLAAAISAGGVGATSTGAEIDVDPAATINSAMATTANAAAYTTDTANVDTGFSVNYGVTSNNPAMQQLIAGLRYLQAAGNATDAATYKADVDQGTTLLNNSLLALQNVNTDVASNINLMTTEKNNQNTAIANLTNQVADISQVDITQVSTEITALQTLLQASYAVTGDLERLTIVSYLPT
jgi:flagellar hook-associated protein 3 FlgL